MKSLLTLSALSLVLALTPTPCFALMSVGNVSKERAKELGIEVKTRAGGPKQVWVEMEFKPEGVLKDFQHVSLEIVEDEELLMGYTPLRDERLKSGRIKVGFFASRAFLDKITLRIVTGKVRSIEGHDLRMSEFVDVKQLE